MSTEEFTLIDISEVIEQDTAFALNIFFSNLETKIFILRSGKQDMLEEVQRLDIKKRLENQILPLELLKKTQTYWMTFYYLVLMMQYNN